MTDQAPVGRAALTLLLVAQALVIAPHLLHLPIWVAGLWAVCALWRVQVYRMRLGFPHTWVKVLMLAAAVVGVLLTAGGLKGLDAMVLLLICMFILKLLEARTRRDALLLVFLGFFCVVTSYLYADHLLAALYSLVPVLALLATLIALHQSPAQVRAGDALRLAGSLLTQALPLMLVLFVVFPRMGPLWALPSSNKEGVTGLSEVMSPADIAELSRSSELVFRARFDGPVPPRRQLYWRALTLEHFDGRRWAQSITASFGQAPDWQRQGEPMGYSVVLQPHGKPWLMTLDVTDRAAKDASMAGDFRWQTRRPITRPVIYEARAWPSAVREPQLDDAGRRRALQLPAAGDARTRQWAQALRREYSSDQALVTAVMSHFAREPFHYTLRPQVLGSDSIDDFLFNTRQGFCAHYAGAMTFVLRAAGIPARVVAGYQGGELNDEGNFVQVRQFDAHAWVEYWQPGVGWQSVDPTFQVAPQRIDHGLDFALGEEAFLADQPLSPLRYRQVAWLNQLRMSWEAVNYDWQRLVLGYQAEQQGQLLTRLFGQADWQTVAWVLGCSAALILAVIAALLLKPWRRRLPPQAQLLAQFDRSVAKLGVVRRPAEGIRDYAQRAGQQLPAERGLLEQFAVLYEQQMYGGAPQDLARLRQLLRQLRRAAWARRLAGC